MQLFCGKQRGSICVLLTLILVPVLMFSGIIVDASRLFASKTVVSGAGDLTMNAALAQYDKKLKDTYGLTAMAKTPDSPDEQQKLDLRQKGWHLHPWQKTMFSVSRLWNI